jgi:AcrR family transcriptional regulator
MSTPAVRRTRQTAEERRDAVLEAAMAEFAVGGLHGTSTDAIARRAGISQPYLFKLFGTKKELFLATIESGFRRTREVFAEAAANAGETEIFDAMGVRYVELLQDRKLLMGQLQSYAACDDPDVQATVRREYGRLYEFVERVSGRSEDEVRMFFAIGMLLNVAAAMDLPSLSEGWAGRCLGAGEE